MTRYYSKRSFVDRRCGEDKRESHNLDYFENNGIEKRKYQERRTPGERRQSDWVRVGKWYSVYVTEE